MNETDGAIALARVEQWIRASLLSAPAHLALDFATVLIKWFYHSAVNLDSFFSIKLIFTVFILSHGAISLLGSGYSISLLDW